MSGWLGGGGTTDKRNISNWPARKAALVCAIVLGATAGLELLFVLVLRKPYLDGKGWAVGVIFFFGIAACVMVIAGYIPIPAELIKRRGRVEGISLLFLLVDWSGAFFSLLSLVAQNTFDPEFGTMYAMV